MAATSNFESSHQLASTSRFSHSDQLQSQHARRGSDGGSPSLNSGASSWAVEESSCSDAHLYSSQEQDLSCWYQAQPQAHHHHAAGSHRKSRLGRQATPPSEQASLASRATQPTSTASSQPDEEPAVEIFFLSDTRSTSFPSSPSSICVPGANNSWQLAYRSVSSSSPRAPALKSSPSHAHHERAESEPAALDRRPTTNVRDRSPLSKCHSWNLERQAENKSLKSVLVREAGLKHAHSMGRRVRFNNQVEVFVYQ